MGSVKADRSVPVEEGGVGGRGEVASDDGRREWQLGFESGVVERVVGDD